MRNQLSIPPCSLKNRSGKMPFESPLDCKEIQPVHPKGNQSRIFIGRTDAEAETPILWPPDVKNWLIWKDPDAGKDWRQEEKEMTEDEMVRWHHCCNGRVWVGFECWWWTGKPGMLQSMGSQRVRHDWATEQLNWTKLWYLISTYIYSHIFLVNLEIFSLFFRHWQSFFYLKIKMHFWKYDQSPSFQKFH